MEVGFGDVERGFVSRYRLVNIEMVSENTCPTEKSGEFQEDQNASRNKSEGAHF